MRTDSRVSVFGFRGAAALCLALLGCPSATRGEDPTIQSDVSVEGDLAAGNALAVRSVDYGNIRRTLLRSIDTLAELKVLSGAELEGAVFLMGGTAAGDGGGGLLYWDGTSTETADDFVVVAPDGGGAGRWVRMVAKDLKLSVRNIADLRALPIDVLPDGCRVEVMGYYGHTDIGGDGGGGVFVKDASSCITIGMAWGPIVSWSSSEMVARKGW